LPEHVETPTLSASVADNDDPINQKSNSQTYIELKGRLKAFLGLEEILKGQKITVWAGNTNIKAERSTGIPSHGNSGALSYFFWPNSVENNAGSDNLWNNASDPCHIMHASCSDIQLLWNDPHIQAELQRKRVLLQESWK